MAIFLCKGKVCFIMIKMEVFQILKKQKWTVSFAESCTGGMLSSDFVSLPGVSSVFKGSIVSYCHEAKNKLLGVHYNLLKSHGAVNAQTAKEMAQGVRLQMQTDWGVSITGEAGPIALEAKVGTVYFAVAGPNQLEKSVCEVFSGTREDLRKQAVLKAFVLLKDALIMCQKQI